MKMKKVKKSSVTILTVLVLMAGAFCTAYAAEQNYKFTIVQGVTSTNAANSDQVYKDTNGVYAYVKVDTASAPSYYTTYKVYNYDDLVSNAVEVINKSGYYGYPKYISGAEGKGYWVNLRGTSGKTPAPNYSTVSGIWRPTW